MKILQILPELNIGGVETGVLDFAQYLVEHEHKSVVVSNGGSLVKRLEKSGSKHYSLAVHKKSLLTMIKMVGELRNIILKEKIDIVHARSRVPAWIAYFAVRKTNASYITTCHGHYGNRIFSQVMGFSKLVIVPSDAIARHMIDAYNVPAEHIRCIPRSVDLDRFKFGMKESSDNTSKTITIVGRITPLKGHTYFLKAMAKVVRRYPLAKIMIIGSAPKKKENYLQEVEALVRRLGLNNNVEFLGNRNDIPELLAKADVMCFSSVEPESFGRVILEAQAVGVPVVATKVGGVIDIIDHEKTGILVMPKDTDAMAHETLRLLDDTSLGAKFTQAAQEKIKEKYTVKHMADKTLAVYEELLSSLNILVIKMSSIGDVVLVTASLRAIRKKYPSARIICLVGRESRKVLQNCPYLDGIIINKNNGLRKVWRLSKELRRFRFDHVIDFQNNRRSHLLAFLSFAKQTIGFNNKKWAKLLTHPINDYRNDIPAVQHQFQILNKLGLKYKENSYLELWPSKSDEQVTSQLFETEWLSNSQNVIGINIAASEKWKTKNWPIEHIAKLCDLLAAKNIRVIITGMEKDQPLARYLMKLTKSKPANFTGKTDVMQLACLIKKCKVYITPDSAPLHVAAAMGVPIIAFFGPTDSMRHIPPARKIVILERKLKCAPCYSTRCRVLTHACMKEITPENVIEEIDSLLGVAT